MYDRDDVELALYAVEEGMSLQEAGRLVGASREAVRGWAAGRLPHARRGYWRASMGATTPTAREAPMRDARTYDPPKTGPLSGLTPDQIENLLLRAVLADLKAGGSDPASISNRSKCELGERLRRATGLPLRSITGFLRISKSSYEYHRARLGLDRHAELRRAVREEFEAMGGARGYRVVTARLRLRERPVVASEKVVRRLMREEGLHAWCHRRRRRAYSSYAGEVSRAPDDLLRHDFRAAAPDEVWLTDITEFALPGEGGGAPRKVYLSPVLDCFDGAIVGWAIGRRPTARLANSSLERACARLGPGRRPKIHSDRGGHYRWRRWLEICRRHGLVRSMSRKGCCQDNSAMEGFFGRLKNEFFYCRDWAGVSPEEFMTRLDAWITYYNEGRIKESLGWRSPLRYRLDKGLTL